MNAALDESTCLSKTGVALGKGVLQEIKNFLFRGTAEQLPIVLWTSQAGKLQY